MVERRPRTDRHRRETCSSAQETRRRTQNRRRRAEPMKAARQGSRHINQTHHCLALTRHTSTPRARRRPDGLCSPSRTGKTGDRKQSRKPSKADGIAAAKANPRKQSLDATHNRSPSAPAKTATSSANRTTPANSSGDVCWRMPHHGPLPRKLPRRKLLTGSECIGRCWSASIPHQNHNRCCPSAIRRDLWI